MIKIYNFETSRLTGADEQRLTQTRPGLRAPQ
jgi:hypothetical protein